VFFTYRWPENMRYYAANKRHLEFAEKHALFGTPPVQVILQMYSEPLQKFRLAGQGLYDGPQPTSLVDCERLAKYFDPLPFWYAPLEGAQAHIGAGGGDGHTIAEDYPLHAITRPMMMYHSWDSQNAWLRQILSENSLYMNRGTAHELELEDGDWIWVESHHGRIRCRLKTMEGVEAHTVWTWNAVGKQPGAWGLSTNASEATAGFLLNHLISESLPTSIGDERRLTNSDPVTGQAAWFDLRQGDQSRARETGIWPVFAAASRCRAIRAPAAARRYHARPHPDAMKLGLVIDLDTCGAATSAPPRQGMECLSKVTARVGRFLWRRAFRACGSTAASLRRAIIREQDHQLPMCVCTADAGPSPWARRVRRRTATTASCSPIGQVHGLQSGARACPYARFDQFPTMKNARLASTASTRSCWHRR
jgi:hypothetical protein